MQKNLKVKSLSIFMSAKNFDKAIIYFSYISLLLPTTLFFLFWTKLYIGLPVAALVGFCFVLITKQNRDYKNIFAEKNKLGIALIAIFAFIWVLLSGQGGLFYQNPDYNMRNAIFYDLLNFDWPVIFDIPDNVTDGLLAGSTLYQQAAQFAGKQITIVYYLGYWLPSAFLGKLFIVLLGQAAGMALASLALFFWTFISVFTALYLFCRAFNKVSYQILLVFIFFSGMDAIASAFYYTIGIEGLLLWAQGRILPHLDAWTIQQFTSNTSALFWVFNQAVPLWIFCGLLLNERSLKYIFLPLSCLALNSSIPMIGAFPIILFFIVSQYLKSSKIEYGKYNFSLSAIYAFLRQYLNLPNFCSVAVFVFSYLYLSSSPHSESFSFMLKSPSIIKLAIILISLLLEAALLILVLFLINKNKASYGPQQTVKKPFKTLNFKPLYKINTQLPLKQTTTIVTKHCWWNKSDTTLLIFTGILFFVIPFINLGTRYDFTMRASLAPLFILCYLTCKTIINAPKSPLKSILLAIVIIGSITALCELLQPIAYLVTGQYPVADNISTLSDVSSTYFDPTNCLGELTSFFMRHILKK